MTNTEETADEQSVDWATQLDHFDVRYAADPFPIWDELRERCPVARSEAFRGMVVPTRYEDIVAVARDTDTYSSRTPVLTSYAAITEFGVQIPPISSDPPYHTEFRRMLLPWFGPQRIEAMRPTLEALCDELIDGFVDAGGCDAALDYGQHIPPKVIAAMLGVPPKDEPLFLGWVHKLLEQAPTDMLAGMEGLQDFFGYFREQLDARRKEPADDLVSFLADVEFDGAALSDPEILGACLLLLIAGIDTTWSAIGASIWHLAQHPDDAQRLRTEPDLWPTAIEELLRAYAPVTMAREVAQDAELAGCPVHAGDPLLLPFPAANRDPEVFERADEVLLDREQNRHVAFGVGIHRCLGSNLARLEVEVALRRFLARIESFSLTDPAEVSWSVGQVRGPRRLPLTFD